MATIKDIARMAGVSISTVSYALNNDTKISKKTKEKILDAARQLNYQKNGIASDLKRSSTRTIALIVTDLAGPYYAELVKGIQEVTLSKGYDLLACSSVGGETSTAVKFLTEKRVDGAIVLAHNISEEILIKSARKKFPIILLDRKADSEHIVSIEVDNEAGSYLGAELLITQGHRDIAYISGMTVSELHYMRIHGYERALQKHGLEGRNRLHQFGLFNRENGFSMTKMLIAQGNLPSAVMYANDEMAIGGINAFKEHGIKVPADVSVIGFDDIELAKYVQPALTTIMQPKYERGALAAHLIFEMLEGHSTEPYYKLPTQLVLRDSVLNIN
ncbi:LacI family transcriptional regulator [Paenibacillus darwinianus]|uniref:LacI family transcriptional regulator n=1 Tax=Paenibacillus darwinianus TaxID=1380763 RepID=A0A9W5S0V3_9BACL|nr:LacI family DNA-binding transcriptional regulator [Paenibacillus darwinianus]EXX86708.1 LacI family transcriptional regulator [Paenibacillus darwinianus]EXX86732.1 LacI family transcriptional regulator [Paenibacillus darwinianus]EXX87465.1 LacI family transcriptional regulator [Paenibacillus darwinianus]